MKRFAFSDELREMTRYHAAHPDFGTDRNGSSQLLRYTEIQATSIEEARMFGKEALLRTVWSPNYKLLDSELEDQEDIDAFTDNEILSLLQQKNDVILQYAATLEAMLPSIYMTYEERLTTFVDKGILPAIALEKFPAVSEQTEWIVKDNMDSVLGLTSAIGRHAAINSDVFTPHHSYAPTETCVRQVVIHELTHRLAGVWSVEHKDHFYAYRTGIRHAGTTWLDESMTELISDSIISGQWTPDTRGGPSNPNYTYPEERGSLQKLLTIIPPEALTSFYFAEDDDGISKKELHRVFRDHLGISFHAFAKATGDPASRAEYLSQLR